MLGICRECKKQKEVSTSGKSEGICKVCYKRVLWKPKLKECKRCKRLLPMHARSLCNGCYNSVFHIDKVLAYNKRKAHNIPFDLYKKITQKCIICDFDKIIDLHHLDHNHSNNSENNLIGLCPNHHKMLHHRNHRREVLKALEEKGFQAPKIYEDDSTFKSQI